MDAPPAPALYLPVELALVGPAVPDRLEHRAGRIGAPLGDAAGLVPLRVHGDAARQASRRLEAFEIALEGDVKGRSPRKRGVGCREVTHEVALKGDAQAE
ncbi:MAG: hypothetical protein IT379_40285 [Deltaproteobacteria bacterium]|nr:hypothetical protein [Deltaproteobacteria bacterium]